MEANELFDVFLSHAHIDAALVEAIGIRLTDEAKVKVWLDRWVLVPGKHWQQDMAKGIEQARSCAVCIGAQTPQGWFREEIEKSLNRQIKDTQFRVIPVILPGGQKELVDNFLELRTWVDFSEGIGDGRGFHLLVSGVHGVPPGRYTPVAAGESSSLLAIRQSLLQLKELRFQKLIDDDIALEFQRRILDRLIPPGGVGSV